MSAEVLLFRKRPLVVQARQVIAEDWERCQDIARWADADLVDIDTYLRMDDRGVMWITTLEGDMLAQDGDWIVKGTAGEFYPVRPAIFEAIYEPMVQL